MGVRRGVGARRGVPFPALSRIGRVDLGALRVGKVTSSEDTEEGEDSWCGEKDVGSVVDVKSKDVGYGIDTEGGMGEPRDLDRKRGGLR